MLSAPALSAFRATASMMPPRCASMVLATLFTGSGRLPTAQAKRCFQTFVAQARLVYPAQVRGPPHLNTRHFSTRPMCIYRSIMARWNRHPHRCCLDVAEILIGQYACTWLTSNSTERLFGDKHSINPSRPSPSFHCECESCWR
jgi:hypothetical protein